jgi:hypothetical protein
MGEPLPLSAPLLDKVLLGGSHGSLLAAFNDQRFSRNSSADRQSIERPVSEPAVEPVSETDGRNTSGPAGSQSLSDLVLPFSPG